MATPEKATAKLTATNGNDVWATVHLTEDEFGVVHANLSVDKLDTETKTKHVGGRPTGR